MAFAFFSSDSSQQKVITRKRNLVAAKAKLGKVFAASKSNEGVDNITLNWTYRHLAKAFLLESDEKKCKSYVERNGGHFQAKKIESTCNAEDFKTG